MRCVQGIQVVRRDVAPFVQRTYKTALEMVLADRAFGRARAFVLRAAEDLLRGRVALEDLVVSKTLRADYKNEKQPHLMVADKMEARGGAGARPRIGDRVPYVLLCGSGRTGHKRKAGAAELAEDPAYVAERGLKPNFRMYLDNGLRSPIDDLFSLEHPDEAKSDMFAEVVLRCEGQRFITNFFQRRR